MEYGKNQDGIGRKELLAVSFGTSYRENLALTIEAVEGELSRAFSDYDLRRAFTSPTILRILKERDGLWIDSVEEALERAVQNGVEKLVIQPTHLMHGLEYQGALMRMIETYRPRIPEIFVGEPLFASMEDILGDAGSGVGRYEGVQHSGYGGLSHGAWDHGPGQRRV